MLYKEWKHNKTSMLCSYCVQNFGKTQRYHKPLTMQDGDVGEPIWQEAVAWLHKI